MAFREDIVPECRASCHPPHTDKRRWMQVVREEPDYVVWCCQRCTEISGVAAIQVRVLARGQKRALHALGPRAAAKHRLPAPKPVLASDHLRTEEKEAERDS